MSDNDLHRDRRPERKKYIWEQNGAQEQNPDTNQDPDDSLENTKTKGAKAQESRVRQYAGTGDGSLADETTEPDKPSDGTGSFGQNGPSLGQTVKNAAKDAASTAGDAARTGAGSIKQALKNVPKTVGHSAVKTVTSVVTKTSQMINVPKPVAAVLIAAIILTSGSGAGLLIHGYNYEQQMMKQDGIIEDDDCSTGVAKLNLQLAQKASVDINAAENENAKKLWSVFKALGATDEQAAGALGNFQAESGIDPTCIEGIYDTSEAYTLGPKKQSAVSDIAGYTENVLFPKYHGGINKSFYRTSRYGAACGVGFFQATGCNYDGLVDSAQKSGKDKMTLDAQIIYMLTTYGKASWVKSWCGKPMSVSDAAIQFLENFEGCSRNASYARADQRIANAQNWYNQFKGTMGDTAYAGSILSACNTSGTAAISGIAKTAAEECGEAAGKAGIGQYDNGNLAKAAVAYAWETKEMGNKNNGTQLYRGVHDAVFPGDSIYMSCDRGVGTAVRWTDADDNFPAGGTSEQDSYLAMHSDLFENLGSFDDLYNQHGGAEGIKSFLQPGDIFITSAARRHSGHGHIVMWVSNAVIKTKYPNSNAEIVSASYGDRSPGCENYSPTQWYGHGYYVYRYKGGYTGTKYKNVAEGRNWSGTS